MAYRITRLFEFSPSDIRRGGRAPHEVQKFTRIMLQILNPAAPLAIVFSRFDDLHDHEVARLHHVHWVPRALRTELLLYRATSDFDQDSQYLMDFFEPEFFFNLPSTDLRLVPQIAHYQSFDAPNRVSDEFVEVFSPIVVCGCGIMEVYEHIGARWLKLDQRPPPRAAHFLLEGMERFELPGQVEMKRQLAP